MTKNYIIPAKNKPEVTLTTPPCREIEEKYGTYYDDEGEIVDYSYVDRIVVQLSVINGDTSICEYVDIVPRNIANSNDTLLDYFSKGFEVMDIDLDCYDISVMLIDPIDSCVQFVSTYVDERIVEHEIGIKYTVEDGDDYDTDYYITVKSFDASDVDCTEYIEYLNTLLATLPNHWECPEFKNPMETTCEWDAEF